VDTAGPGRWARARAVGVVPRAGSVATTA
jgi:hypothetical protein